MTGRRVWAFRITLLGTLFLAITACDLTATSGSPAPSAQTAPTRLPAPVPLLELIAPDGTANYTADEAAAMRDVTQRGMTLQPGQIGYLRREPFPGSVALSQLRSSSGAANPFFTTDTAERLRLVDSGRFRDAGVLGYVATAPGPGLVALQRFTDGASWRLALAGEDAGPRAAGGGVQSYRRDATVGYVPRQWIRAGAVYFGMFDAAGHQRIIQRTQQVFGRKDDWWGGVRDYSGRDPSVRQFTGPWPAADFSRLEPSIGFYDDSDPKTLERQIAQASGAGLSFFSFYWYWNAATQQERMAGGLHSFLAARNSAQLDFTVAVCASPADNLRIPREQFGTVARLLVGSYLARPNILRANDGRPIVSLCDTRALGAGTPADTRAFTDALRTEARAQLGEELFVTVHDASGYTAAQIAEAGGDAGYCTTVDPAVTAGSYRTYLEQERSYLDRMPGSYGRCVMSGFDERPRYPIEQPDPALIRWMPDQSLELFRQAVRGVRDDIADSSRPPMIDNFVFVYAWNEWHEGGIVEPDVKNGCAYLDALRDGLGLTEGSGCVPRPALPGR